MSTQQGAASLGDIKPEESWILSEENGVIKFREAFHDQSYNDPVHQIIIMALALTEKCCELGRGKVYFFAHTVKPMNDENGEYPRESKAYQAFAALPDLLYVDQLWTDYGKDKWRNMAPEDRLVELHGTIILHNEVMVMPIAVEDNPYVQNKVYLEPYATSHVTLLIATKAYVGLTEMMRSAFELGEFMGSDNVAKFWYCKARTADWDANFPAVECPLAADVVRAFSALWQERREGTRVLMETLILQKVKACRTAFEEGF